MKHLTLLILLLGVFAACKAPVGSKGKANSDTDAQPGPGKELSVAFYNVENLFDTEDNPNKIDEDFLPEGRYKWTTQVYLDKLDNMSRAISQIGDENGPEILGLAEVENRQVIEDLIQLTALKSRKYEIVHEESPDMRGIDVALVYDRKVFRYHSHRRLRISFPAEPDYTSRDVLLVSGKVKGEILHILVNHWPSRRGGQEESEPRRLRAAEVVKFATDSLFALDPEAKILLMGDFNDDPHNKSLVGSMQAKPAAAKVGAGEFFNPMSEMHDPDNRGTLTYRGKWNLFDQFLVSPGLLAPGASLKYVPGSAQIYNPEFLQVGFGSAKDAPRRAIFRGEFVKEGFSDHFPVFLKLRF